MQHKATSWDDIEFFDSWEFDSPDLKGSGVCMNLDFVSDLDFIRRNVGVPLSINSGVRTSGHNKKIGGAKYSSHLRNTPGGAVAADLNCSDNGLRRDIILLAEERGINRIGIGSNFIHLDADLRKMENRYWHYYRREIKVFGFSILGLKQDVDR